MPIDPSIPLGVQPPQIQNPLASISAIAQLEDVRAQVEQRRQAADAVRQKAADEAAIRTVMAQSGGDFEQALPRLRQINPRAALAFATDLGKQREAEFKGLKEQMDYTTKQFEVGDRLLAYAHDEPSFQVVKPMIAAMSPNTATALGDTYDPVKVQGVRAMAQTAKERHDQELEGLKLITDGKLVPGINTIFATADTPEKWAGFQDLGKKFGVPAAILDAIGPFSPENVARAKQNAISPEKQAELAAKGTAETDAQANERYRSILSKQQLKQPVTPEEAAWAKAFEQQKTLATDVSASAAMDRQTRTIGAQVAQQARAQNFTQLQAARQDIRENVDKPYATARSGADTLRDVVAAAQGGNKVAGSLQSLETTMAAVKAQGLNRINMPEIATTAQAGSLWDHITSYIGQKAEGQPVPANIQRDMLAFADILDKAAAKKAKDAHDATNKLYGTSIPYTYGYDVGAPAGQAAPAPTPAAPAAAPIKVGGFTVRVK